MIPLAALLYGLFVAAALFWCWLAGTWPWPLWAPGRGSAADLGLGLAAGGVSALLVVVTTRLLARAFGWARRLNQIFRDTLGPLSDGQVLVLALLSSVGEELLFRGAMQPSWGLWITSAIFAVMHFPLQLSMWPWTAMAGLLGLWFGLLTEHSGTVAGAVLAHFLINLLNLRYIVRLPTGENLPTAQGPPSMDGDAHSHAPPPAPVAGLADRPEPEPHERNG